jgi:hypothetical protein
MKKEVILTPEMLWILIRFQTMNNDQNVGFEVLTAVVMKSSTFWDIMSCSQLICYLLSPWFLARLILRPWRYRRYVPPKRRLTFSGLHDVMSQKTAFFNDQKNYGTMKIFVGTFPVMVILQTSRQVNRLRCVISDWQNLPDHKGYDLCVPF